MSLPSPHDDLVVSALPELFDEELLDEPDELDEPEPEELEPELEPVLPETLWAATAEVELRVASAGS